MNKKLILVWLLTVIAITVSAQTLTTIKGTITDAKGNAIPAASVHILNTNFITTANNKGIYTLTNVPGGKYNIEVSAVGYASLNKAVNIGGSSTVINLQMASSANQLSEVIVSAQKRDEEAQRVPLSVSTLSSKQVQDYRVWNAKDITAIVPNLYSANPGDNRNVTSIRGITTTSYDPAVATYIDGVNQFGLDTYIPQLFDVDRIEVLRGPQGTLYGRNATGGVINIITKQPSNQTSGFASVDIGNYNLQRYTVGIRTPLIKDKLFLGVAGQYSGFDGYYTNIFNNSHFDKQHYYLGNYYLKYLANSKLTLTLNVKHSENRNNGAFALAGNPTAALSQPFMIKQNALTTLIDNVFNASLMANYAGRGFNFTSQTSYQQNYRYYDKPIDGDFSPLDILTINNNYGKTWNNVKTGIQEFRFSSPISSTSRLNWTAGLYGFINSQPNKQASHYGAQAALFGAPPNITSTLTNIANNYGTAVFGQATYTISPKVDVTGGIRYDYEHKKAFINGTFQPDGGSVITTNADQSATATFRAFLPKVSIAYHPANDNTLFGSYSRGFRAGGLSQLGSDPSSPPLLAFKPEYSNNYEIGSKNTFWDKKGRLNITAFYTTLTDAQVPTVDLLSGNVITTNQGKLNSKGIEAEFAAVPLKGLEVDYNFGYTHARYTQGVTPNTNGNHQIFTPDVTSMLALQYTHAINDNVKLVARGEWRYIGDQYFDLANQIKQNGYHLLNARLGVTTKCFDVFLWANNIANKKYIDYAYDFGGSHLGNPAIYGVSLNAKF